MSFRILSYRPSANFAAAVAACALATIPLQPAHAQRSKPTTSYRYSAEQLATMTPASPNPYLALLPEGVEPDWEYWNSWLHVEQKRRIEARRTPRAVVPVAEDEENDTIEQADALPDFGTLSFQNAELNLSGTAGFPSGFVAAEPEEDNGSIFYAATVPLPNPENLYVVSGVSGNGIFGSGGFGTGDFDFYRIPNLSPGQVIELNVDANERAATVESGFDPFLALYSANGELVASSDDEIVTLNSLDETVKVLADPAIRFTVFFPGDYYVAVGGELIDDINTDPTHDHFPANPFNPATGSGDPRSEGAYELSIRLLSSDQTGAEDNGSISLATVVPAGGAVYSSVIGDGPQTVPGDFDFYALRNLSKGDLLIADTDAQETGSELDSFLAIWNSSGNLLMTNDDDPFRVFSFQDFDGDEPVPVTVITLDSFIAFEIPANGTYYVSVGSYLSPYPSDPFDPSSGPGASTTGVYDLALRIQPQDPDLFRMDLSAGDVIGGDISLFHGTVDVLDYTGKLIFTTHANIGSLYPVASLLPFEGGKYAFAYVATADGPHYVRYKSWGTGDYSANLSVFRPVLEYSVEPEPKQRLFVDFDGATVDTDIFFRTGVPLNKTLSPLSEFLPGWGLQASDEDAVIDAIMLVVRRKLRNTILYPTGKNPSFDIDILNSRNNPGAGTGPDTSIVVVGGTISQLGISTIGISESIDPGNFDTTETAVVLLDLLSEDADDPNSLNGIAIEPGAANIVDLIGAAVGNIVAHEAGHFFGDYHTDNVVTPPNIMDEGGSLENTIGLGPDSVFGSADDIDVRFRLDRFAFLEGFSGVEDTLNTIAFALPSVPGSILYVNAQAETDGIGTYVQPFNNLHHGVSAVPPNGILRLFPGNSDETFAKPPITKPLTLERAPQLSGPAALGAP